VFADRPGTGDARKSTTSTLTAVGKTLSETARALYAERPAKTLYHYTSIRGLIGIVSTGHLRATDVHYLSDSAELQRTANLLRFSVTQAPAGDEFTTRLRAQFLHWVGHRLNELGAAVFAGCFTENGNLLSQWRGYCDPGKGLSLGFAANSLVEQTAAQSWRLGRCIYDNYQQNALAASILCTVEDQARQELPSLEHLTPNATQKVFAVVENDLLQIAALIKDPGFIEEQEWRVVSPVTPNYMIAPIEFREGQSMLTPYMNFRLPFTPEKTVDLEHVWVGPTPHSTSSTLAVMTFLSKHRASPRLGVGYCNLPYRTW
jgi:hypothetical protein